MAFLQATKSALDAFFTKHSGKISIVFIAFIVSFALFTTLGLIGAGCVFLGGIVLPLLLFFSPVLVPLGVLVSAVTLMTLYVLTAAGIIEWRLEESKRRAKEIYEKVVQWLNEKKAEIERGLREAGSQKTANGHGLQDKPRSW